jgi:mRNA-degrading endonuclease YafQ of YafQ-DinJ toxin-antitoxin module
MGDLKYIAITQLFWDTLEPHRSHSRYGEMRAKIAQCVERKIADRRFMTDTDHPFLSSSKALKDIWHAKLTRNPDVVMFYTLTDDTLNLAMCGSHHDYPNAGKNMQKQETLARRINNAVAGGHVASPRWGRLKWKVPSDILASWELEETTLDELEAVMDALERELYDAPIYLAEHGRELEREDLDVVTAWLEVTDRALEAVREAQTAVRARLRVAGPLPIERLAAKRAPGM